MLGWNPTLLRDLIRLATFWTLAIWQGGFIFYSGFVLKIGARELQSDLAQGFITRKVTLELENLGWIALITWGIAIWATRFPRQSPRLTAAILWGAIVAIHLGLHFQWHAVDRALDVSAHVVKDDAAFHMAHRIFMWAAALQLLLVVILSGVTLQAWQREHEEPWAAARKTAPATAEPAAATGVSAGSGPTRTR